MIEILKELAFTELLKYKNDPNHSNYDNTIMEVSNSFGQALELCSSIEQINALMDAESELNRQSAIESEKYFIERFIAGYKFLKEIDQ